MDASSRGATLDVLLRNTWARSREPAGFRSRRVHHIGWTILNHDGVGGRGVFHSRKGGAGVSIIR
ncbi:MAG: hypothetical protein Q8N79_06075, partial [Candidatus Methanoperedens sp.]|nr:hypothetical protein [Candidatus Methanoperedens sp.]